MNCHAVLPLNQRLKPVLLRCRLCFADALRFNCLLKLEIANRNMLSLDAFAPVIVRLMYHHHPPRLFIDYVSTTTIPLATTCTKMPSAAERCSPVRRS